MLEAYATLFNRVSGFRGRSGKTPVKQPPIQARFRLEALIVEQRRVSDFDKGV
jgi:hypothetical protein